MAYNISTLPPALAEMIGDVEWQSVTIGQSGTHVFRLVSAAQPDRYLKIAPQTTLERLDLEKDRLEWLRDKLPVPCVLAFAPGTGTGTEYLLTSAIPGFMTCDPVLKDAVPAVVRLLAAGLRMLHSLPITDCPFDQRLSVKMADAQQRTNAGLVDETDFDESRKSRTAHDLYAELCATQPVSEDLVFTHGDYCLPNIIIQGKPDKISGFIDVGRAGIADRYQDLALAARSLAYNFGQEWVPYLFEEYGITKPDNTKIEFYQLLDEFF